MATLDRMRLAHEEALRLVVRNQEEYIKYGEDTLAIEVIEEKARLVSHAGDDMALIEEGRQDNVPGRIMIYTNFDKAVAHAKALGIR